MVKDDVYYIRAAWITVIGFTLFRLFYAGAFLLAPDETNYWQWGRHLAFGYHDQAPMIGWLIRLSTVIFGDNEIGVRLPSVIGVGVASAYMVAIARRWMSPQTAWHTAILSQSLLVFNVGGLLATADGLQAAAWAAATYHAAGAFETDSRSGWLIAGLWFGFGLLSKYTMVIFLPGVLLYGLFSGIHRDRLAGIWPYAGLALGALAFSPVVIWNAANSWNSVRHVAFLGGANQSFSIHWNFFGDYIASQAALLSPLVFILVLLAWGIAYKKRHTTDPWIYGYLFFTSFPMVIGFAFLSLHTRVYGNWPGAGFIAPLILVAAFFAGKKETGGESTATAFGKKIWPWAIGTSYLITTLVLVQVIWPVLPLPTRLDRTSTELQGWEDLGEKAGSLKNQMPRPDKTFLFGLRYQTASELAFYTPGKPDTVSINRWKRPNVYDYWWEDQDLIGWDAVGVTDRADSHETKLNEVFEHVDPPILLEIYRDGIGSEEDPDRKPVKIHYLYRAYRFKGGLRWIPPDAGDIRAN